MSTARFGGPFAFAPPWTCFRIHRAAAPGGKWIPAFAGMTRMGQASQ